MQKFKFLIFLFPCLLHALIVGVGKTDITPPIGTPSAGYTERKGEGMEGVHDRLLAVVLYIDNGQTPVAFCSVDHLGFTHEMVEAVKKEVYARGLNCEIYIGSTHTHSGGGAFLNIPVIGAALAGPYNAEITQFYVDKTALAILKAAFSASEGKIGIGYGQAENLSRYRSTWPENVIPQADVAVIKVEKIDGTPLAVLFNYAIHPTILRAENRLFSADFVGSARDHLQTLLGVQALYFNGAQGDIAPQKEDNSFEACDAVGKSLALTVQKIWEATETSENFTIDIEKVCYELLTEANPQGFKPPVEVYQTEMNLLVLNKVHAFLTIPGELSTVYDARFKALGQELGYAHVSILGLTNDAHGYIISPEAWRKKTFESNLSFGGENYGSEIEDYATSLLRGYAK